MTNKQKEIRIIYSRLQHLISQIPLPQTDSGVDDSVVKQYHSIVDNLSQITKKDYSKFKVDKKERSNWANKITGENEAYFRWNTTPVRTKIFDLIGQVRVEYDVDQDDLTLKNLFLREMKDAWGEYKTKIIVFIIVLVIFSIAFLFFKVNLFKYLGLGIGI